MFLKGPDIYGRERRTDLFFEFLFSKLTAETPKRMDLLGIITKYLLLHLALSSQIPFIIFCIS